MRQVPMRCLGKPKRVTLREMRQPHQAWENAHRNIPHSKLKVPI
ncbi:MAG: hypothetical protein ACFE8A_14580 [Candidatus Hodarchaeota archaeon]